LDTISSITENDDDVMEYNLPISARRLKKIHICEALVRYKLKTANQSQLATTISSIKFGAASPRPLPALSLSDQLIALSLIGHQD
jgi:hypothetical protein